MSIFNQKLSEILKKYNLPNSLVNLEDFENYKSNLKSKKTE